MCPRGRFPLYSATASVRPRKFSSETHGVVRPPTIFATYSGFAEKMHPLGPPGTWAETSTDAQFPTDSPPSLGNLIFSAAVRPSALPRGFSRLLKWCTHESCRPRRLYSRRLEAVPLPPFRFVDIFTGVVEFRRFAIIRIFFASARYYPLRAVRELRSTGQNRHAAAARGLDMHFATTHHSVPLAAVGRGRY